MLCELLQLEIFCFFHLKALFLILRFAGKTFCVDKLYFQSSNASSCAYLNLCVKLCPVVNNLKDYS